MGILGEMLQQARRSRGLSLEEVERDTRISRRYLEALEAEDFNALPDHIFGRGFLRIYAQYLGLDPQDLVSFYPTGPLAEHHMRPLPELKQPSSRPFNWLIAGVIIAVLFGIVAFLYWSDGNSPQPAAVTTSIAETNSPLAAIGGCLNNVTPSTMPDLRGCSLDAAFRILKDMNVAYFVVEVDTQEVPAGVIFRQSPQPTTPLGPDSAVTLVVRKGTQ